MGPNATAYPIVLSDNFSIKNCRTNPAILFVFGDNEERSGMGGQAIIRQCENSIGIATKKSVEEYWEDKNLEDNKRVIIEDIGRMKTYFEEGGYRGFCFPKNGFGTGLAKLHIHAPLTFLFLCERLHIEFQYNNLRGLKTDI